MVKLKSKVLSLGLTFGMILSAAGCGSTQEAVMDTSIHVDTQLAEIGTLSVSSDYIGSAEPEESVSVTPLVSGTVEKVNVKVGDQVKEGDVLCQFDDSAAQISVTNAEDAVATAKVSKQTAQDQADVTEVQTKSSIKQLKSTIETYEKSLKEAKKSYKELKSQKTKLKKARKTAKTAYVSAQTLYKTAQALYINFKSFLKANEDCQSSAGLALALTSEDEQKAQQAKALSEALTKAGTTVEYLSDSGLESLKENAETAGSAYEQMESAYSQVKSGVSTAKQSISTLEAQLDAAEDSLKSAQKTKDASDDIDTDAVYDAQIQSAEDAVAAAEYQQSLYTVTAPIDGVVESVNAVENEIFAQGYPAFTISSKDSVKLTFYVPEDAKNFIQVGEEVTAQRGDKEYSGTVSSVSDAIDQTKGLFKIEALIPMEDQDAISSGVSMTVELVTQESNDKIIIPYDSVYYDDGQAYVFCVRDGLAARTDIETGIYNDSLITVTDGLSVGDEVITTWATGLKEGAQIASDDGQAESGDADSETSVSGGTVSETAAADSTVSETSAADGTASETAAAGSESETVSGK